MSNAYAITANGAVPDSSSYHYIPAAQWARAAEALDWPVCSVFAERLWWLSNHTAGWEEGAALLRGAGYIPYCGFPLSRSGKIPSMTRAEVERELDNNPLCWLDVRP